MPQHIDFGLSQHPHTHHQRHGHYFINGVEIPLNITSVLAGQYIAAELIFLAGGPSPEEVLRSEDFQSAETQMRVLGIPDLAEDDTEDLEIKIQWDDALQVLRELFAPKHPAWSV